MVKWSLEKWSFRLVHVLSCYNLTCKSLSPAGLLVGSAGARENRFWCSCSSRFPLVNVNCVLRTRQRILNTGHVSLRSGWCCTPTRAWSEKRIVLHWKNKKEKTYLAARSAAFGIQQHPRYALFMSVQQCGGLAVTHGEGNRGSRFREGAGTHQGIWTSKSLINVAIFRRYLLKLQLLNLPTRKLVFSQMSKAANPLYLEEEKPALHFWTQRQCVWSFWPCRETLHHLFIFVFGLAEIN